MRLVFLGSGEFGIPTLQRIGADHDLVCAVTQPDRPAGRSRKPVPTAVGRWATERGLPLIKAPDVNEETIVRRVADLQPDASVVIAFGQKLGKSLVAALGGVSMNLHASLLPAYRGAAPINWALIRGERVTGVSVISIDPRMDAGLIYGSRQLDIDPASTAGELHDSLSRLGPDLVSEVLTRVQEGRIAGVPQDEARASKAPKLSKADAWVDFGATGCEVRCRIHGLTPWPGVQATWRRKSSNDHQVLRLLRVREQPLAHHAPPGTVLEDLSIAVGDGAVELLELQKPGGRPMGAADFARGHPFVAGDRLESGSGADAGQTVSY